MTLPLGPRICIVGPSCAGKSTLAERLGRLYNLPVTHLDQLYHQPTGNWVPRPWDEFAALHDAAVNDESWVIEGNYKRLIPRRFDKATVIIVIKTNRFVSLYRFLKRYYKTRSGSPRIGQPLELEEKFNWNMIWWIMQPALLNKERQQKLHDFNMLIFQYRAKVIVISSFKEADLLCTPPYIVKI